MCPSRDLCVRLKRPPEYGKPYRGLTVPSGERHEVLRVARERQETEGYTERDGIGGTISWAVRRCGLRRSRYRGLKQTLVQHSLTAATLNHVRSGRWFSGELRTPTRTSPFAALADGPAAA